MNRTLSESSNGGDSETGRRVNRSISSGNTGRSSRSANVPPRDRRFNSVVDSNSTYGSGEFNDDGESNSSDSVVGHHKRGFVRSESVRSSSPGGASGTSPSKSFKSLWKKAVSRLTRKTSKEPNEPGEPTEPNPLDPVAEANAAGEIDPVYSFLKLTSVMPRQGTTSVIPDTGHRCCPGSIQTDEDWDIDESTYTHSNDPTKCQCPCHLPQRLEACHTAWKKAFVIDKHNKH